MKHESEPHRVQRTSIWTTIQVNQNWFFVIFDTDFWPIVGRDVGALTHSRIIPNSRRHVQFSHLRFSKHLPKLSNPVFALRLGRSRSTRPKYQSSKPQWISVCWKVCVTVCVFFSVSHISSLFMDEDVTLTEAVAPQDPAVWLDSSSSFSYSG